MYLDSVSKIPTNASPELSLSTGVPVAPLSVERLPFTVKIVHDEHQLAKAVFIRHAAYHRHVPDFARQLSEPEPYDRENGSAILIAESKLDGEPLGTIRIQTNRFKPLNVESSVELPDWLRGKTMAQASRLGISLGSIGRMVKIALFKAYYLYCLRAGIDWMVIAARSPLDRQYEYLLFSDVYPELGYIPIKHAKDIPHRIMAFDVQGAQGLWETKGHPLLNFMVRTHHPDIDVTELILAKSAAAVETGTL